MSIGSMASTFAASCGCEEIFRASGESVVVPPPLVVVVDALTPELVVPDVVLDPCDDLPVLTVVRCEPCDDLPVATVVVCELCDDLPVLAVVVCEPCELPLVVDTCNVCCALVVRVV